MNTIRVSATKARNNFFALLDKVASGAEVIIEKDKKEVAIMKPKKTKVDWEGLWKATERTHGLLKDYTVEEIAPTRKKGAWGKFGEWDKGLELSDKSKSK